MKFFKAIALTLLVALCATSAFAADIDLAQKSTLQSILQRGELRVGLNAAYPPFEMTDKNGKLIGFDVDLAKELGKAMGVKVTFVNMDFDGLIPALMSDKFDVIISGMTASLERSLKIAFSDPYILMGQGVLVNNKLKGKVKYYRDLNKPEINVVSCIGTTGEEAAKKFLPKASYKSFDMPVEGTQEVVSGRADAFVYDLNVIEVLEKRQGAGKVFLLPEPFTFEPWGLGHKQGDPDFTRFLNAFLFQMKNDGRYERIYDKWLRSDAWEKMMK